MILVRGTDKLLIEKIYNYTVPSASYHSVIYEAPSENLFPPFSIMRQDI